MVPPPGVTCDATPILWRASLAGAENGGCLRGRRADRGAAPVPGPTPAEQRGPDGWFRTGTGGRRGPHPGRQHELTAVGNVNGGSLMRERYVHDSVETVDEVGQFLPFAEISPGRMRAGSDGLRAGVRRGRTPSASRCPRRSTGSRPTTPPTCCSPPRRWPPGWAWKRAPTRRPRSTGRRTPTMSTACAWSGTPRPGSTTRWRCWRTRGWWPGAPSTRASRPTAGRCAPTRCRPTRGGRRLVLMLAAGPLWA